MITKKRLRYWELISKYSKEDDFEELINLLSSRHDSLMAYNKSRNIPHNFNPFETLISDLELEDAKQYKK